MSAVLSSCRSDKSPFEEEESWDPIVEDLDGDGYAAEEDCNDSDSVIRCPGSARLANRFRRPPISPALPPRFPRILLPSIV